MDNMSTSIGAAEAHQGGASAEQGDAPGRASGEGGGGVDTGTSKDVTASGGSVKGQQRATQHRAGPKTKGSKGLLAGRQKGQLGIACFLTSNASQGSP